MYAPDLRRPGAAANVSEWFDLNWSPIIGCTPISPGCANCTAEWYAAQQNGPGQAFEGVAVDQRWTGKIRIREDRIRSPLSWSPKPRRVFVAPMSDLFHEKIPRGALVDIFNVMEQLPQHRFLILTKRADRMAAWSHEWPVPPHVWLGVSVEDQKRYRERISPLLRTRCRIRWINFEPLLGPINLRKDAAGLQWVAAGPEFGDGARPCDPDWLRSIRDQCAAVNVPLFMKGELDGRRHEAWPV